MKIEISKRDYLVSLWRPGDPVMKSPQLALDTETELLVSGEPIKPVLLQAASTELGMVQLVWHTEIAVYLKQLQRVNPTAVWFMHNAPFDCEVLGLLGTDELKRRIDDSRLVDTSVRFILHRLNKGDEAVKLWQLALKDAPADSALKKLAAQELEKRSRKEK